MSDEIELKLELRPQDADVLESSDLIAGKPKRVRQRSIYFDTLKHDLAKAGLSLRIRLSGRKRIQTVKADDAQSAGLFARPEWERPVADDTPIIDHTTPIQALLGEKACDLTPVFEVHVERRIWEIDEGGAIIELVIDRGEVIVGDRQSSICEVELELKRGDTTALFDLARKLDAVAPLRLGVRTKAERGYALLGPVLTACKAEQVVLKREIKTAQALRQIVRACLRQFRLNEDLFLAEPAPEALHQARVALRRLRSALSIFKSLLADDTSMDLRDELHWLAAALGEARDIDVLLERTAPGQLHAQLSKARHTAYAGVDEVLASARVRALMLDLTQWTVSGSWLKPANLSDIRDQPAREFASGALDRLRRKVKKDGRNLAEADDEARHVVRKDAKKLRYAAAFFAALFDRKRERLRYKRFIAVLEGLQDKIGALNDRAVAPDVLARLGIVDDPGTIALLFPGSKRKLLAAAEDDHKAPVDAKRFWR